MSETFEKRLKSLIDKNNMTVTELAKQTGVPATNIRQWLTGTTPNINQVNVVAEFFGVSVDSLVFGKTPKSSLENFLSEIQVHDEIYRVNITKLVKKKEP